MKLFESRIETNAMHEKPSIALELVENTYNDFISMVYSMYSYDFMSEKTCYEMTDRAKELYSKVLDKVYKRLER